jgi:hypothetical protein
MIQKVLSDTRQIDFALDPEFFDLFLRADSRAEKDGR